MTPVALPRVHLVIGTRPEAIKLAPVALALRSDGGVEPVLVATGQHPELVGQALDAFGLAPDVTLGLHRRTGDQAELVGQLVPRLDAVLADGGSAAVVVQGDTTSALVGGLVAFWRQVPVVHVEAGLRSGDLAAPFPEEANRRLLGVLAALHLAPTAGAARALAAEGVTGERVLLVGNTVVDAVQQVAATATAGDDPRLVAVEDAVASGSTRLLLVTAHRRESWGAPLDRVLGAVVQILDEHPDVRCVLPAHPNPAVRAQVDRAVACHQQVVVTAPLAYPQLCRLLARAALVLSDSGGIQEEAPSFGVPVLVLREVTERTEAVEGGWATLVGTDPARIVAAANGVLAADARAPAGNPFGDGRAGRRSARAIARLVGVAVGRAGPSAPPAPPPRSCGVAATAAQ